VLNAELKMAYPTDLNDPAYRLAQTPKPWVKPKVSSLGFEAWSGIVAKAIAPPQADIQD